MEFPEFFTVVTKQKMFTL